LQTIRNWRQDVRIYPQKEARDDIFFNVAWSGDWNFKLTTPSWINGGYTGNITLTGIERLINVTDVF
jgi:hypothetical protein